MLQNMTEGAPLKLIIPFMVPLLIGNVFQQLYNIADIIIVGRTIGVNALAAVGAVSPLFMLTMVLTIGLSNGFTVVTGQRYGAQDMQGMRRSIATCVVLSIFFVFLIMGIMHLVIDPMLVMMNIPPELMEDAYSYVMIIVDGLLAMMAYNLLSGIMRSLGDSKTPLYFLILTSALNIGLDLLFIVPFKMGILGAALATDISQAISGVVSFGFLCRKFEVLHMQKGELAFSKRACIRLMGIGVPMGLQCSITAIGSVIMQWAVNVLGSTAVAAVTAASKTMNLLTVPLESIGTAMATYSGQNLGAARMDRVRKGVTSALLIATVYSIASALILHFADVAVMSLFLDTTTEVEIVAMGREYLFWNSVFFVPLGALIVWRYSIQGLGFSTLAMMAGVAEMIARTAVAIVLVPMLGYFGAELANPAAWIAACIFLYPAYRWTCRQLDDRLLAARLHIQSESPEHEAAL